MYVTGRWVSANVVSTMFIAWIVAVIVFAAVVYWQRRKPRKNRSESARSQRTYRPSTSGKSGRGKR